MATSDPNTLGDTLEELIERVVFTNPATHPIREHWAEVKRAEHAAFERVCRADYERRLEYHRVCQTPNPSAAAGSDAGHSRIRLREELELRLAAIWGQVLRRVQEVLEDRIETSDVPAGGAAE